MREKCSHLWTGTFYLFKKVNFLELSFLTAISGKFPHTVFLKDISGKFPHSRIPAGRIFQAPSPSLAHSWKAYPIKQKTVSVSDLCSPRIGLQYLFPPAEQGDRSWEYINRSQTHECGNWAWGRAIPFLEIFVSKFRYFVFAVQLDSLRCGNHAEMPPALEKYVCRRCGKIYCRQFWHFPCHLSIFRGMA